MQYVCSLVLIIFVLQIIFYIPVAFFSQNIACYIILQFPLSNGKTIQTDANVFKEKSLIFTMSLRYLNNTVILSFTAYSVLHFDCRWSIIVITLKYNSFFLTLQYTQNAIYHTDSHNFFNGKLLQTFIVSGLFSSLCS